MVLGGGGVWWRGRGSQLQLQLQLGEGGDGLAEGGSGAAKAKLLLGRRRGLACETSSQFTNRKKHI